jgi:hypothetical protein
VFSANFVAALPNAVKSHSALRYLTNDWTLSGIVIAQSGEPYSLYEFYGAVASIYYGNFPNLLNPVLGIKDPKHPRSALTGNNGAKRNFGANNSYFPAIDLSQVAINYITPGNKGVPACNATEPCATSFISRSGLVLSMSSTSSTSPTPPVWTSRRTLSPSARPSPAIPACPAAVQSTPTTVRWFR